MIQITSEPIDVGSIVSTEVPSGHGGQCFFAGRVRNINVGRNVVAVEYDAFAPLAESLFATFVEEAKARFADGLVATIVHRTGRLGIGEVSVAISVSTRHRDEAFKACRYLIEELKHRAPIWKKEFYVDGESEWVQGHALCGHKPDAAQELHSQ